MNHPFWGVSPYFCQWSLQEKHTKNHGRRLESQGPMFVKLDHHPKISGEV